MYTIDSVNVEIKSLIPRVYHGEMKVVCEDKKELFVYMTYEQLARGGTKERLGLYDKSCLDYFDKPGAKPQEEEDEELRALMNMLDDADPPKLVGYEEYNSFNQTGNSAYRAAYAKLYNLMLVLTPDHEIKVNGQRLNLRFNSARGEVRHLEADYDSHHASAQSYDAEAEYVDETGGKVCLFVNRISPEDRKDADRLFHRISKGSMQQFLSRQTREDTVLRREQYYKGHFGAPAEVDAEDEMTDNVEAYVLNPMLSLFEEDDYFTQSRVGELEERLSFEGELSEEASEDAAEQVEAAVESTEAAAEQNEVKPEEASAPEANRAAVENDASPRFPELLRQRPFSTRSKMFEGLSFITSVTIKRFNDRRAGYHGECLVTGYDEYDYLKDIPHYPYMYSLDRKADEKESKSYCAAGSCDSSCIETGGLNWEHRLFNRFSREDFSSLYYPAYEVLDRYIARIRRLADAPETAGFTVNSVRAEFVPQLTDSQYYDAEAEITDADGKTCYVYFKKSLVGESDGKFRLDYYYCTADSSLFDCLRRYLKFPVIMEMYTDSDVIFRIGQKAVPEISGGEEYTETKRTNHWLYMEETDLADLEQVRKPEFVPVYALLADLIEAISRSASCKL